MTKRYTLANDPIFYSTVVLFALLTTALPAFIGQPTFLLVAQTLALFTFIIVTLHQRMIRQTVLVLALWLVTQFIVFLVVTVLAEERVQVAIPNGFAYGMAYIEWFYQTAGAIRPDSFAAQPLARISELIAVTLGTLLSAGLVGVWFLVRALNLAAFNMGVLLVVSDKPLAFLEAVPVWSLLRISGYAGFIILFAEPLLTSNWNPGFYLRERRQLFLVSIILTLVGLLLELILPDFWRTLFR